MYGDWQQQRQQKRRERRQQISSLQIVFVSILAIGLLLAVNFSARIRRGQQIEEVRAQIQATIDIERQTNLSLRRQLDYAASSAAIEDWAHTDGKMVRPGEILVVPVPGVITPTPSTPRPATSFNESARQPEEITWHLWWRLFFDSDPPKF